jgi:hypothetical protein
VNTNLIIYWLWYTCLIIVAFLLGALIQGKFHFLDLFVDWDNQEAAKGDVNKLGSIPNRAARTSPRKSLKKGDDKNGK